MKHWIHLPVAAAVAALIGAGSALLSRPGRGSETRAGASDAPALEAMLAEVRAEQRALAERVAALASAPAASGASGGASGGAVANRAPSQDLDQAIAAYMAKQLTAAAAPAGRDDALAQEDPEIAAIADRILSGELGERELEALWEKLRQEDRIDAVVAEIERLAASSPNNPDLQTELGHAYVQKLFDVGVGPMASVWGDKADRAYDRALELDETHWDARFSKALSLSNWPAFLGKQGESMRHFEILMEQQERATPTDEHAMTYLFLGNLYAENGQHDKALATWRRGAERFPDSDELRAKTGGR